MPLITPSPDQIDSLQHRDAAYYFSGAFDAVLRKYGLDADTAGVTIATREVGWSDALGDGPIVMEGCLSNEVASRLDLRPRRSRSERLQLTDAAGEVLTTLVYSRTSVRWIPPSRDVESKPYPFVSEDPFWNVSAFDFQTFEPGTGSPVLFATDEAGHTGIVGIKTSSSLVLGIPLLDVIVQHHAAPYYPVGYYQVIAGMPDVSAVERWLLDQLGGGREFPRAPMWPQGYRAALTVRHDYDRAISREAVGRILAYYDERGIRSTWFWRLCHAAPDQVGDVVDAGHEVALHTEVPSEEEFRQECDTFAGGFGFESAGYSAHGGIPAAGNLGLHQIDWADARGMVYGERLGPASFLPHQAVVLREGRPAAGSLILPPQHRGLDLTTAPDGHRLEALLPEAAEILSRGEHCVLMNHPDIHIDQLEALLDGLDLEGVWPATLAEVADWFRRSKLGVDVRVDGRS